MTAQDRASLEADLAGIRALVSGVAAEAERLAAAVAEFSDCADLAEIILAARRQGIREGRALAAAEHARQACPQLTVIPGGKAPEARKGTARAARRTAPGGAA